MSLSISNSKEAVLLACMSVMGIDDDFDSNEINTIMKIAGRNGEEVSPAYENAFEVYKELCNKEDGIKEIVYMVREFVNEGHIICLMLNLIDVAMASGGMNLKHVEKKLIDLYATALDVEEKAVELYMDIISEKNAIADSV